MNTYTYFHNDHLGSTSVVTNENGDVVEETSYDPWGQVVLGGTSSKFLYTGQEHDEESGLHYYNARYYDSEIRRFVQPDPIVQDVYSPQSLNRYSYVLNNPLRYTDPSGNVVFAVPIGYWLGGLAVTAVSGYLSTPQGQQATKAVVNTVVKGAQNTASAISNAASNTAKSISSMINNSKPTATNPPPSQNTSNRGPSTPSGGPLGPIGGAMVGTAGAIGQQIQTHGNSLRSTATTWGYTLRDKATGAIQKIGETIYPDTRYSKGWLDKNNLEMFREISGTKFDIRVWEHEQIGNYLFQYGQAPMLNDISRSVNVFR